MAKWTCSICEKEFSAGENFTGPCEKCGADSENVFPVISSRRVTGDRYNPYTGDSRWAKMANHALKMVANDNFNRR